MTDIANLGFNVNSTPLDQAKVSLNTLAPAAERVATATEQVEQAFTGAGSAASAAAAGIRGAGSAAAQAASGADNATGAVRNFSVGLGQADAAVVRYRQHLQLLNAEQARSGGAIRLTANEGLNFARQMQDIGVTAAMGMNPFMIAVQQGPQLFDILEQAAIRAGITVGAVFRGLVAQAAAAILPFLPIIALVVAAIATIAAGFALGARAINQHAGNVQRDLNLTKEQMERLATAGTNTAVTLQDVFGAFIETTTQRLSTAFNDPLHRMQLIWTTTLDAITRNAQGALETIVGAFIAVPRVIGIAWQALPHVLGDVMVSVANGVISVIERMINIALDRFHTLAIDAAHIAAAFGGHIDVGAAGTVTLPRLTNPNAGAAGAIAGQVAAGIHQGLQEGRRDVQSFFHDVGQNALGRRDQRVIDAAGAPNADHAARGHHARAPHEGPTQTDLFGALAKGAQRDIETQKTREQSAALDQTAQAAAAMTYEQNLLNQAQQRGIVLTPAQTAQLHALAQAYGVAKVAADDAHSLHEIIVGSDRQLAGLRAAHELIGLYGRDLAYATEMQRLLNEAQQKGMTPEAIAAATPDFQRRAGTTADQQTQNAHDQFMENMRRQSHERIDAAQAEARAATLGEDAATSYRIEEELLAQARQQNIDLTPDEISAIHDIAQAQGAAENATRHLTENVQFARQTTHGFFDDLIGGLRQGKSFWESFADAAVGAINKIMDRLMSSEVDQLLNQFFGHGGSTGGGGIGSIISSIFGGGNGGFAANGGAPIADPGSLDVAGLYAKGDAFTNGVYTQPTAFAFGRNKTGVMGEDGAEAVMPLTRGPDGSLGVQMYGGNAGGTSVHAPITIHNDNRVTGAISSRDIIELNERYAESTKRELSRQLPALIQQHNTDGAMV